MDSKVYIRAQAETLKSIETEGVTPEQCIFRLEDDSLMIGFWKGWVGVVVPPEHVILKAPENDKKLGWDVYERMKQKPSKVLPERIYRDERFCYKVLMDDREMVFEDRLYKRMQDLLGVDADLEFYDLGDGETGFGVNDEMVGLCTTYEVRRRKNG